MMKKLLFLLAILALAISAKATHLAAGQIYYLYVGDSTGVPNQYIVYLELYRDVSGIPAPATQANIELSSSCFATQNIALPKILPPAQLAHPLDMTGVQLPDDYNCIDTSLPNYVDIAVHLYADTVVLPGMCSDFAFSFGLCCRNGAIDNLDNPLSRSWYIETQLNNTQGPNNSAYFVRPAFMNTCVGTPLAVNQSAYDTEGDSLFYENVQPLNSSGMPIPYAPGYSLTAPVSSSSGYLVDSLTGFIFFTPNNPEVSVLKLQVSEYRRDTGTGMMILIGSVQRDFQLSVDSVCRPTVVNWHLEPAVKDTNDFGMAACGDSILFIKSSNYFDCTTLSPDGSDFVLYDTHGNTLPIIAAGIPLNCDTAFSKYLWVRLAQNISYDDTLTLVTRKGIDTNTLRNVCSFYLKEFDTTQFIVNTCQTGFSLEERNAISFSVFPNPAEDFLTISVPEKGLKNLQVLDLSGKVVLQSSFSENEKKISLEKLSSGIYFISLESELGKALPQRVIKK